MANAPGLAARTLWRLRCGWRLSSASSPMTTCGWPRCGRGGRALQRALVAVGGVLMDRRSRKPLHDVITAVRLGKPVAQCGFALQANAERHLRSRVQLAAVFSPDLLAATQQLMQRCHFDLREISYNYPQETVTPA
jgi:error-prone DNA polymerase